MHANTDHSTFESLVRLRSNRRKRSVDKRVNPEEVKAKVLEDISFLRGRIDHIKRARQPNSNPSILQTYESMLESRESVLVWLNDNIHEQHQYQHRSSIG